MKIDWSALLLVAVVSIVATVVFSGLLATGIRLVSISRVRVKQGEVAGASLAAGYAVIGLAGLLVLFGLYLIVPQFH